ncbi:hypothetical protein [Streptomyces sp. NRRL WC-3742]|uniref:hypothetical protein n=1 Tax=Streptomyces sp. NRRL WC-3742 TaxID=1463934 RepID=UPI0006918359|nr:hypothetical protein [Streptomyces sp. NRRL WC-3742]
MTAVDRDLVWRFAELRWRCGTSAGFVAACTGDARRARTAAELGTRAYAVAPLDLRALEAIAEELAVMERELDDHPLKPVDPAPDELDRIIREHARDVLRPLLPDGHQQHWEYTRSSLDYHFRLLCGLPDLDPAAHRDAHYLYGRATMALDLGHSAAFGRAYAQLRALWEANRPEDDA